MGLVQRVDATGTREEKEEGESRHDEIIFRG